MAFGLNNTSVGKKITNTVNNSEKSVNELSIDKLYTLKKDIDEKIKKNKKKEIYDYINTRLNITNKAEKMEVVNIVNEIFKIIGEKNGL